MNELSIMRAATPIAIPTIDRDDTVRMKPELDLLNICRQAIRVIRDRFTIRSVSDAEKG